MRHRRDLRWVVILGVAAGLVQVSLAPMLRIGPGWLDVALAFITLVALRSGGRHAGLAGLFLGLAVDLLVGHWVGLHAICWGLAGYVLGHLMVPFDERSRAVAFVAAGAMSLCALVLEGVLAALLAGGVDLAPFLAGLVPSAVLTAVPATFLAPYQLGFPLRAQTEDQGIRTLKLWFSR